MDDMGDFNIINYLAVYFLEKIGVNKPSQIQIDIVERCLEVLVYL